MTTLLSHALGRRATHSGRAALVLGIGICVIAARYVYRKFKRLESHIHTEETRDEALTETYPASDPPASQYFDIPENRQ